MTKYVLAIDQGTTSSRAVLFDRESRVVAMAQEEYRQHYPRPGWVEHDPEDIWASVVRTCREAIGQAGATPKDLVALGIANQRETVVVWERAKKGMRRWSISDRTRSAATRPSGVPPFPPRLRLVYAR